MGNLDTFKGGVVALRTRITNSIPKGFFLKLFGAIPSSARDAAYYQENLFPDFPDMEKLTAYVGDPGRLTVDFGSGLTHENPYSLINVMARKTGENVGTFIGVEPKLAMSKNKFALTDKVLSAFDMLASRSGRMKDGELAARRRVVGAALPATPFPDKSVDTVLSSALVGHWITDPKTLLGFFKEFARILTDTGEIRIHPFSPALLADEELRAFIESHFEKIEHPQSNFLHLRRKGSA